MPTVRYALNDRAIRADVNLSLERIVDLMQQ